MARQVIHARVEASPLVLVAPADRRKCGTKASLKTSARWAPCSTSVRGRGRKSVKAVADLALLEVEAGASDELPLVIRQSFKRGRYSPSTGME
jgi:hypothetical protein